MLPSREELAGYVRELLADWYAKSTLSNISIRPGRSEADYPVLHGLVAHCHRMADATLKLDELGMLPEALPLIRSAYEASLTACWIAQVDDGLNAFAKETLRNRRNTMDRAARTMPGLVDTTKNLATGLAIDDLETSATSVARNFEELCNDLEPVGTRGYVYYRIMSSLVHPTAACADQYMDPPEGDDERPLLLFRPHSTNEVAWLYTLVGSLIWAGRAVEYRETSRERRNFLRRMARKAGVVEELKASERAWRRQQKAERERREKKKLDRSSKK